MHNYFEVYYFIDKFNLKEFSNINRKINIIFRDYSKNYDQNEIIKTQSYCKKKGFKLFLANDLKLSLKLGLDGVYIPAFNKKLNIHNICSKTKFQIIGSAHNICELKIKEKQNCQKIFIVPLFKTEKNKLFLGPTKFNLIAKNTTREIICLGGINSGNIKKIYLTKSIGFASISWIKKNGLNKNLGRF